VRVWKRPKQPFVRKKILNSGAFKSTGILPWQTSRSKAGKASRREEGVKRKFHNDIIYAQGLNA
jgi:hypothetical protein